MHLQLLLELLDHLELDGLLKVDILAHTITDLMELLPNLLVVAVVMVVLMLQLLAMVYLEQVVVEVEQIHLDLELVPVDQVVRVL